MPIQVSCRCGFSSTVPDEFAGKRGRCKKCGALVDIPDAATAAILQPDPTLSIVVEPAPVPVVPDEQESRVSAFFATITRRPASPPAEVGPAPSMVACPYCAEPIAAAAKKCKHCGEYLDARMRPQSATATPAPVTHVTINNSAIASAKAIAGKGKRGFGCCSLVTIAFLVSVVIAAMNAPHSGSVSSPPSSGPAAPALLPPVAAFLSANPQFGRATRAEPMPDWAKGRRQGVRTDKGRDLLFYLKGEQVQTIYNNPPGGPRELVWGETD